MKTFTIRISFPHDLLLHPSAMESLRASSSFRTPHFALLGYRPGALALIRLDFQTPVQLHSVQVAVLDAGLEP